MSKVGLSSTLLSGPVQSRFLLFEKGGSVLFELGMSYPKGVCPVISGSVLP